MYAYLILFYFSSLKDKRFSQFIATKRKIVDLYDLLEMDPESSFGHDLVCEDDSAFKLSSNNMDQMKDLFESVRPLAYQNKCSLQKF